MGEFSRTDLHREAVQVLAACRAVDLRRARPMFLACATRMADTADRLATPAASRLDPAVSAS